MDGDGDGMNTKGGGVALLINQFKLLSTMSTPRGSLQCL